MAKREKGKKFKEVQLQNSQLLDVAPFQDSVISLRVEVFRKNMSPINPFAGRESALHVLITNDGEKDIDNAIIEAFCGEGLQLVDPGALFGTTRRHVRLPQLRAKKSIKYKLALRTAPTFTSGTVTIEIKGADWRDTGNKFVAKVGVTKAN